MGLHKQNKMATKGKSSTAKAAETAGASKGTPAKEKKGAAKAADASLEEFAAALAGKTAEELVVIAKEHFDASAAKDKTIAAHETTIAEQGLVLSELMESNTALVKGTPAGRPTVSFEVEEGGEKVKKTFAIRHKRMRVDGVDYTDVTLAANTEVCKKLYAKKSPILIAVG